MTKAPLLSAAASGRAPPTVPLVIDSWAPPEVCAAPAPEPPRRIEGTLGGRLGRGTGVMLMLGVDESFSAAACTV